MIQELEWSGIEESIWRQKARIDWLKLGDSNTKFFSAYVKARINVNAVTILLREDGSRCVTQQQMKEKFRNFYRNLMGSAAEELHMPDQRIINMGPVLNSEDRRRLCTSCSSQEIREALKQMDSNNAPGIDGYNVYFFKKAWPVIGEDVIEAIQQFFNTGYLPRELNIALITLIPKCDNASVAKEF